MLCGMTPQVFSMLKSLVARYLTENRSICLLQNGSANNPADARRVLRLDSENLNKSFKKIGQCCCLSDLRTKFKRSKKV